MVAIPQSGLLAQVSSLRLPLGHSGPVLTLSNAACTPYPAPTCYWPMQASALLLHWGSYRWARNLWVLIYLFIFPPGYVALCGSKAYHRLGSASVSWFLETSLFFKTPFQGWSSIPTSFVFLSFIYFFYLLLKTMGCFSGCLMSSAGIQKLFCGIYSVFKCSFDEFVGEKVVSLSYSSTILGLPLGSTS